MKNVYLINLSFGLAGIERRFANLWRALYRRKIVFPILVIPSSLAEILDQADLLPNDPAGLIITREPKALARLRLPTAFEVPLAILRSRIAALGYRSVWSRIERDPNAILHVGMNTSALRPPDTPAVYECVDANLEQLDTRHLRRASRRRCIIHCQTDRIRTALDSRFASRGPLWQTVSSPTCFAEYEDSPASSERDFKLVAFVGRLAPEKNPLLFIEAIAMLRRRGHTCRAVMLGTGPLRAQCEGLIKQYGLENVISMAFLPKPIDVLRRAAIYVTLQTGDNYPSQSLLEAMGAGCAIIASDVGETKTIVTEEVGLRTSLTVNSAADALEHLLASPEITSNLGSTAARIARSKYSPDRYAAFVEKVYELAEKHHRVTADASDAVAMRSETAPSGKS